MNLTGNTILITGGGSGIGRGLAEELHELGNQVVIAGRRKQALDETTAANPGMKSLTLDIQDPAAIRAFAAQAGCGVPLAECALSTTPASCGREAACPAGRPGRRRGHRRHQPARPHPADRRAAAAAPEAARSTILNVSSGLAFVPLAMTPTYCATKAAIHSYTQSLRYQLKGTADRGSGANSSLRGHAPDERRRRPARHAARQFLAEVMGILKTEPTPSEICVESA